MRLCRTVLSLTIFIFSFKVYATEIAIQGEAVDDESSRHLSGKNAHIFRGATEMKDTFERSVGTLRSIEESLLAHILEIAGPNKENMTEASQFTPYLGSVRVLKAQLGQYVISLSADNPNKLSFALIASGAFKDQFNGIIDGLVEVESVQEFLVTLTEERDLVEGTLEEVYAHYRR